MVLRFFVEFVFNEFSEMTKYFVRDFVISFKILNTMIRHHLKLSDCPDTNSFGSNTDLDAESRVLKIAKH